MLADGRRANADAAAEVMRDAGFDVSVAAVDVSSRESVHALVETATTFGDVSGVIHEAGVSPSQASSETILSRPGSRPRVHHRQRLPDGRRSHRVLLLRAARPALNRPRPCTPDETRTSLPPRVQVDESSLVREHDRLYAVAKVELLEDVRDVRLDGRLADVELACRSPRSRVRARSGERHLARARSGRRAPSAARRGDARELLDHAFRDRG